MPPPTASSVRTWVQTLATWQDLLTANNILKELFDRTEAFQGLKALYRTARTSRGELVCCVIQLKRSTEKKRKNHTHKNINNRYYICPSLTDPNKPPTPSTQILILIQAPQLLVLRDLSANSEYPHGQSSITVFIIRETRSSRGKVSFNIVELGWWCFVEYFWIQCLRHLAIRYAL